MIPLKIDSTQIIYFLFKHSNEAHILQLVDILLESFFFFSDYLLYFFLLFSVIFVAVVEETESSNL